MERRGTSDRIARRDESGPFRVVHKMYTQPEPDGILDREAHEIFGKANRRLVYFLWKRPNFPREIPG